ncbi:hypothetical protein NA56DRAFT_253678 [Hyaloscypha hepaticicola]|uniref:Secreted protein n=1 Tax=Hyaloscypha hepaticicola TaxID=2082293 RepID=A0A2J6PVK1_9HELO|nr:hypothetical protein NA56DRAFT_253678 [Hyaloscypha hepaticicola]
MYIITLILAASTAWAIPFPLVSVSQDHFGVLCLHASTAVNPDAVKGTSCLNTMYGVSKNQRISYLTPDNQSQKHCYPCPLCCRAETCAGIGSLN